MRLMRNVAPELEDAGEPTGIQRRNEGISTCVVRAIFSLGVVCWTQIIFIKIISDAFVILHYFPFDTHRAEK